MNISKDGNKITIVVDLSPDAMLECARGAKRLFFEFAAGLVVALVFLALLSVKAGVLAGVLAALAAFAWGRASYLLAKWISRRNLGNGITFEMTMPEFNVLMRVARNPDMTLGEVADIGLETGLKAGIEMGKKEMEKKDPPT